MIKTAEEIVDAWFVDNHSQTTVSRQDARRLVEIVKQREIDAIKHGMTIAAEIAGKDAIIQPSNDAWQLLDRRKEAILAARDTLKEI